MYAGAARGSPKGGKWRGRNFDEKCTAFYPFRQLIRKWREAPYLGEIGDRVTASTVYN